MHRHSYPYALCYAYCVQRGTGRRLVVPDIHGCYHSLQALLAQVQLRPDDQLFLLGDYIDRGPHSKATLQFIMQLKKQGYEVYPLRGNHEQMLLEVYFESPERLKEHLLFHQAKDLLSDDGGLDSEILDFLLHLPFFIETDVAILVHGGLDCNESNPFVAFDKLLWTRDSRGAEKWLRGKKLIHGHTPRLLFQIEEAIEENAPIINLDNGCVIADDNQEAGNLLCYDIDRKQIIAIQPNVDALKSL
ncbi:serine/threonine protein phosphatase 1 [Thermonema lapsum]|uniref:Serine/threonine protein phosphatase 1 n=1 Tax=Thermonema lapsum TaxID=28195 RepID=A0A846MSH7_9BACT|nr:metallophosphoesterase family protein [Thermonema lapsum]NIK74399.1 serine/threonine protein phosphatase 1 [Thermonema lapsum]